MLTVAGCPLGAVVHFPVTQGSLWLDWKITSRNKATAFSFFIFIFYVLLAFVAYLKRLFLGGQSSKAGQENWSYSSSLKGRLCVSLRDSGSDKTGTFDLWK